MPCSVFPFLSPPGLMRLPADGHVTDGQQKWQVYICSCETAQTVKNDMPAWIIKQLQSSTDPPVHRSIGNVQMERAICSKVALSSWKGMSILFFWHRAAPEFSNPTDSLRNWMCQIAGFFFCNVICDKQNLLARVVKISFFFFYPHVIIIP